MQLLSRTSQYGVIMRLSPSRQTHARRIIILPQQRGQSVVAGYHGELAYRGSEYAERVGHHCFPPVMT
jgi:hypothetical protein